MLRLLSAKMASSKELVSTLIAVTDGKKLYTLLRNKRSRNIFIDYSIDVM